MHRFRRLSWWGLAWLGIMVALIPVGLAQLGESKSYDVRIQRLLDSLSLQYKIDDQHDFRLGINVGGGRSQIVWINTRTTPLGNMEIRDVWSPAYTAAGPSMPAEIANKLLRSNDQVKLGSWRVITTAGKAVAVFGAQIAANTDGETLKYVLQAVAKTADDTEKELTGRDDL